eukprot:CAMPEP_0177706626 /NCGR_PEP_ID=MMETSP0484_2-20121128/9324_1 /TAXON_ID=354590 /ORGANISM="Rhodomonas lens, Strain RHODO" /LENGTH=213 /DNA_ID=CAMNT_0019218097 /DNA_START=123 /DNA_END=764 /DNA_ORIENTATION=-
MNIERKPSPDRKKLNPILLISGSSSPMSSPRNSPRHLLVQRHNCGVNTGMDSPRRAIQKRGSVTIIPDLLPSSENKPQSMVKLATWCIVVLVGVSVSAVTVPKLSRMEIDVDYSHALSSLRGGFNTQTPFMASLRGGTSDLDEMDAATLRLRGGKDASVSPHELRRPDVERLRGGQRSHDKDSMMSETLGKASSSSKLNRRSVPKLTRSIEVN